jgi:YggT family protein
MFIVGHFFSALAYVIHAILWFYMWLIIIRALLSWVNPDPYNQIVRIIYNITEPVLYRIRALIPINFGGIDLSPLIVILGLVFLNEFLIKSLYRIADKLLQHGAIGG